MPNWFESNPHSIGKTPPIRMNRIVPGNGAVVLAKIEGCNLASSVKDRVGTAMISDAGERYLSTELFKGWADA